MPLGSAHRQTRSVTRYGPTSNYVHRRSAEAPAGHMPSPARQALTGTTIERPDFVLDLG